MPSAAAPPARSGAAAGRSWPAWALAAATVLLAAGIGLHVGFVNGPPEWEWAYREAALAAAPALLAVLAAAVAVWFAAVPRPARGPLLLGVLAVVFSLAVVAAQPGGFVRVVQSISS